MNQMKGYDVERKVAECKMNAWTSGVVINIRSARHGGRPQHDSMGLTHVIPPSPHRPTMVQLARGSG